MARTKISDFRNLSNGTKEGSVPIRGLGFEVRIVGENQLDDGRVVLVDGPMEASFVVLALDVNVRVFLDQGLDNRLVATLT